MVPITWKVYLSDFVLLTGRVLLALIFVHEGFALALNFAGTVNAMAQLGIGAPLVVATIALQIAAGLSVALGLLTRLGAVALGLFCVATAALFHTNFANHNELLHFEKDLAIAGGMFTLAIAGAGGLSLEKLVGRVLRSLPI
ncbi:DoxX family protein [Mesorhizobium sp. 1M-11]|uniref:DoxX family protein n=1 Tax=Mesorhizobium sp. 1M-11 TaxID=1529006 RepID=UPI0006C73AE6|nr:DoxX family protein [Mesorhizobium sp. 1M-11]